MRKIFCLRSLFFLFFSYSLAQASDLTTCYALIRSEPRSTIWMGSNPGTFGVHRLINTATESWDVEDYNIRPDIFISVNPDAEKAKRVMLKVVDDAKARGYEPAEFLGCKTESLVK